MEACYARNTFRIWTIPGATQPDVQVAEGGKAVIYYTNSSIWAHSWIFPVQLVELFWTRRTDQMQVSAGKLPLTTGTAMFSLVFIIQHTSHPPSTFHHAFYAHISWRSFNNLQPICPCLEEKDSWIAWMPSKTVAQEGGWELRFW